VWIACAPTLSDEVHVLERLEHGLYHAYRLALMLGLLALVLTPLHRRGMHHADVVRVDGPTVELAGDLTGLEPGHDVRIYRFNPSWTSEIGWARVTRVGADTASATIARRTFHWPIGSQGQVVSTDDGVEVNIGSDQGLEANSTVQVFVDRKSVGRLRLTTVEPDRARGHRLTGEAPVGAAVTAFSVANQAAWFYAPWLAALEWLALLGTLALWAWAGLRPEPGRALGAVRRGAIAAYYAAGTPGRMAIQLLLGIAMVPVVVEFTWEATIHITHALFAWGRTLRPWTEQVLYAGNVLGGTAWVAVLAKTRRSPALVAWHALRFRPPAVAIPRAVRGFGVWTLHLAVFYAFGSTLTGFLAGNVNAIIKLAWGRAGVVQQFADLPAGIVYMVTHTPGLESWDDAFMLGRLTLWSLTICGCLLGYTHTVVSILWKREPIRNIDFTPVGWAVNALCYGPLLGGVLYRIHGSPPAALDPGLAGGPAWGVQLTAEFLLNLLYTLSIWNLGTMFGVMVDKGVQKRGFYSFVRHPSYTLEALMFVTLGLTGYTTGWHYAIALVWPVKYFLRSERDDIFMNASNPDYTAYREEVRWKYIPGLF
jgi:protein-S-isoprenylcysteine O-methyltransferase Ste14